MTTSMPGSAGNPEPFDIYTDQFNVTTNPYGVTFLLQRTPALPQPGQSVNESLGVMRMSLEHAKVFAMLLRRQLKAHEEEAGFPIRVMPQIMNSLGLSEEDWDRI